MKNYTVQGRGPPSQGSYNQELLQKMGTFIFGICAQLVKANQYIKAATYL